MADEGIATGTPPAAAPVVPDTPAAPVAPVATPPPPVADEFDAHKYIGKNGEFLEGWKEGLIDPTQWKEGFYDNIKDVKGLLKSALDTKKMVGKKTIVPLTDKSTTEEIAAFREAHGITGKYNYTPPKDIEMLDMSPEALAPAFAELDKAHLTQKQFDVAMAAHTKSIQALQQAVKDNDKAEFEEAERIIRAEAGNDYDNRVHLASRIIEENTADWPEDKKGKLIEALNESPLKPYVLEFIATVGNKFVEHKIITDMEASLGPADLEAKIYEEMHKPAYMNGSDPAHKLAVATVQKLFQEKEARTKRLQSTGIL